MVQYITVSGLKMSLQNFHNVNDGMWWCHDEYIKWKQMFFNYKTEGRLN